MTPVLPPITEREEEVLRLTAQGLSRQQIGRRLCISAWTVKRDADKARKKLGAASLVHAVALYMAGRVA